MIKQSQDIELTARNTFGIACKCRQWIDFSDPEDLEMIISSFPNGHRWKVVGGGSNILFTGDFDGTLLHSDIKGIEITELSGGKEVSVRVGSGVKLDKLIEYLALRSIWGLENLSGIPGEIGAGAVQNVGAYGVEIKDCIDSVEAFDAVERKFHTFSVEECHYGYRESIFKSPEYRNRYIITAVVFRLSLNPAPQLRYGSLDKKLSSSVPSISEVRELIIHTRREKLPEVEETGSAGSYFKNPVVSQDRFKTISDGYPDMDVPHYIVDGGVKIPAAWLIEQCGWKGKKLGNAGVWHKQPLILVNLTGKASPSEIIALEEAIVESVKNKFNITLSTEVEKV